MINPMGYLLRYWIIIDEFYFHGKTRLRTMIILKVLLIDRMFTKWNICSRSYNTWKIRA
jgi:hypothetical protein